MKLEYLVSFFFIVLLLGSCSGDQPPGAANQSTPQLTPPAPIDPSTISSSTPAATPTGVQHYICPNNCAGSGGPTKINCPVCGTEYMHNQAYHDQMPATTTIQSPDPTTPPATTSPLVASGGVKHYTCPNNCAGSGADQPGACAVCGTAYVHNQAYHNQGAATPSTAAPNSTSPAISPVFKTAPGAPTSPIQIQQPTTTPAAATNAAGVYHYTCSNGCAGGSGSAGSCATCGAALVHNQAYHN